jgi:hypothetical protein
LLMVYLSLVDNTIQRQLPYFNACLKA